MMDERKMSARQAENYMDQLEKASEIPQREEFVAELRRLEKALAFGETYGTGAQHLSEVLQLQTEEFNELKEQMKHGEYYIDMSQVLARTNFRKLKARMMYESLIPGESTRGNHRITYDGALFLYFYRGTLIYGWNAERDEEIEYDAGDFEGTVSTRNQRKEIQQAIADFRDVMGFKK